MYILFFIFFLVFIFSLLYVAAIFSFISAVVTSWIRIHFVKFLTKLENDSKLGIFMCM
jgi:hypothetical protein